MPWSLKEAVQFSWKFGFKEVDQTTLLSEVTDDQKVTNMDVGKCPFGAFKLLWTLLYLPELDHSQTEPKYIYSADSLITRM